MNSVKVSRGPFTVDFPFPASGGPLTVGDLPKSLVGKAPLSSSARTYVDGRIANPGTMLQRGQTVELVEDADGNG